MHLNVDKSTVVVFDLDDTLYKEIDFVYSAYAHICETLLEPSESTIAFSKMVDDFHRGKDVFDRLKNRYKMNIGMQELVGIYRFHFPNIRLSTGARDLLARVFMHGGRLGIITDGRELTQRNKLRALGIEHLFSAIVISETFGSEKPHERNFRFFENEFPGCRFVYIGDNFRKDFVSPNRLGWTTIGLADDGRNIHSQSIEVPNENRPQHMISSLQDIVVINENDLGDAEAYYENS